MTVAVPNNFSARNYRGVGIDDPHGPLKIQVNGTLLFDSTAMGPEYATSRQQNILMGFRDADPAVYENTNRVAIGNEAGNLIQGNYSIAIGLKAGRNSQFTNSIAIGYQAGEINQRENCIAIGAASAQWSQQLRAIAIGGAAGYTAQEEDSLAIGSYAGSFSQKTKSVAIGNKAGYTSQNEFSIAIGNEAGKETQSSNSIAIGNSAGQTNQSGNSVAIGFLAGQSAQKSSSVAVGNFAGNNNQSENSVAIGTQAGQSDQVSHSICIGYKSSITADHENFSKNKISLCLGVREKDFNNSGGAANQHSFVVSAPTINTLPGPLIDGGVSVNNNTAGDLATKYFNTADDVGFLNVKINRGSDQYVGMMALFNLRKII